MAINHSFFSKRDSAPVLARSGSTSALGHHASTSSGAQTPAPAAVAAATAPAAPVLAPAASAAATSAPGGSQLTVGPNIKLKGVEITDCDTLVVEGMVEATMRSRVIHIAQQGAFEGAAEIDIAEIHGRFTGTLTVREKLIIHSTGQVSGTIRYGKLVVAEGGQLSGEVAMGVPPAATGRSAARTESSAA